MCGIVGIINFNEKVVDESRLRRMMKTIKHRGPDDEGVYIKSNIGLGHVRLSIIDLSSAGHQPMFSEDERFCIIFNGEIYNYIELKEELKDKYNFKTKTDTEVILASYLTWGKSCLHKFNGDFAFVIYDQEEDEIFAARDRYGIKPFYYYKDDKQLIFASEIKAIIPLLKNKGVNEKLIFEILIYNRTDQSLETFFTNIVKLAHGHYFSYKKGVFSIKRWYNLYEKVNKHDLTFHQYREALKSSVRLRLRSDVPVGVSLSGGVDSSAITSIILHDFGLKEINTFSSIYGDETLWADESRFINMYRSEIKNMHYTYPSAETFFNDFRSFITAQGEPVAAMGPYAQFKVMEKAHGNVVVTLDGQGADEQLAGYHNFFGSYFLELLRYLKLGRFLMETVNYMSKHQSVHALKFLAYYILPLKYKNLVGAKVSGSLSKDFFASMNNVSDVNENLYNPKNLRESLMQHFEYKLEHLLKWDDLNAMHFSIESRVPFLDHNLVEKTLSLPSGKLIHHGTTKHILRESLVDVLPEKIKNRTDKKPFSTPSDDWFRDSNFKQYIQDMINSSDFKNLGYFDIEDCNRKYKKHLANKADLSKDIWKWINIYEWFNIFIKNNN